MTPFAQTRYDLHDSKVKTKGFEESMGISHDRKKIDLREEYFVSSPLCLDVELNALIAVEQSWVAT